MTIYNEEKTKKQKKGKTYHPEKVWPEINNISGGIQEEIGKEVFGQKWYYTRRLWKDLCPSLFQPSFAIISRDTLNDGSRKPRLILTSLIKKHASLNLNQCLKLQSLGGSHCQPTCVCYIMNLDGGFSAAKCLLACPHLVGVSLETRMY